MLFAKLSHLRLPFVNAFAQLRFLGGFAL